MLHRALGSAAILFVSLASGCGPVVDALFGEPTADVDHPKTFDRAGLAFSYPGNWTLELEEETIEGIETAMISVESPNTAIVTLMQWRPGVELGPEYAEEFMNEIQAEFDSSLGGVMRAQGKGMVNVERDLLGHEATGKQRRVDVSVLGEKVPHTQQVLVLDLEDRSIAACSQAANEDLPKAQPGFDLVLDSLKTSP